MKIYVIESCSKMSHIKQWEIELDEFFRTKTACKKDVDFLRLVHPSHRFRIATYERVK